MVKRKWSGILILPEADDEHIIIRLCCHNVEIDSNHFRMSPGIKRGAQWNHEQLHGECNWKVLNDLDIIRYCSDLRFDQVVHSHKELKAITKCVHRKARLCHHEILACIIHEAFYEKETFKTLFANQRNQPASWSRPKNKILIEEAEMFLWSFQGALPIRTHFSVLLFLNQAGDL